MKKIILLFLFSFFICSNLYAVTKYTIKSGDTLWDLSAKYYGDPTLYPILLEVNHISNPRTILVGTVIIIPNKGDMQNIANENDPDRRNKLIDQATGGGSGSSTNGNNNNGSNGRVKNKYVSEDEVTTKAALEQVIISE